RFAAAINVLHAGSEGMLSHDSIAQFLRNALGHAKAGRLGQAEMDLRALDFDRFSRSIREVAPGLRRFTEPAEVYGRERIQETGAHIDAALALLKQRDQPNAVSELERAVARWSHR